MDLVSEGVEGCHLEDISECAPTSWVGEGKGVYRLELLQPSPNLGFSSEFVLSLSLRILGPTHQDAGQTPNPYTVGSHSLYLEGCCFQFSPSSNDQNSILEDSLHAPKRQIPLSLGKALSQDLSSRSLSLPAPSPQG